MHFFHILHMVDQSRPIEQQYLNKHCLDHLIFNHIKTIIIHLECYKDLS